MQTERVLVYRKETYTLVSGSGLRDLRANTQKKPVREVEDGAGARTLGGECVCCQHCARGHNHRICRAGNLVSMDR